MIDSERDFDLQCLVRISGLGCLAEQSKVGAPCFLALKLGVPHPHRMRLMGRGIVTLVMVQGSEV